MKTTFFDDEKRVNLLPLTFTRPCADLRVGIVTIAEKWTKSLNQTEALSYLTEDYLQTKYPFVLGEKNLFINGRICPNVALLEAIDKLNNGEVLQKESTVIAYKTENWVTPANAANTFKPISFENDFTEINYPEDIFKHNDTELKSDFSLLTKGRSSANISNTNTVLGEDIFVEEGYNEIECSTFNTKTGPIYIGANTTIMEGSHFRGAFALCNNSVVKLGTKVYGATTVGPFSTIGGEVNNAVIWGYSNKGHDGFLGNSVLGQWCNMGADSNNSNLKNNYAEVGLWDYTSERFRRTGLQFCGLIMADHAKCGINTMFNTGTVIGVSANVFGAGFPRNFVPDFAWGGVHHGYQIYTLNKMFETAKLVFARRNKVLDDLEKDILTKVFELTESYRHF